MDLEQHLASAPSMLARVSSLSELDALENQLVGRASAVAEARRNLGKISVEERPQAGAQINRINQALTELIQSRRVDMARAYADALLAGDELDLTAGRTRIEEGTTHLIQQTMDEVCDIFVGLGYRVAEGPEVELGWFNFDALNTPPHHPARSESDTLYVDYGDPADEVLLRTQTSPMQVRYLQLNKPPVYVVVPGKVFRSDNVDATHLPVFHQVEGLAVDEGIVFSDLKGTLAHFAREFFGPQQKIRLRPHFFPFTEPSAELDVSCFVCNGDDNSCRVCKGTGWLEMAGCGMVDPNVLDLSGHDSGAMTGFAFGLGVERLAMVRHGIANIRVFIENDLRVLRQFR